MFRISQWLTMVLMIAVHGSITFAPSAVAGVIGTDEVVPAPQAGSERERIRALVARPEVAKQLQALGVPPENAQARVNAMTNQEIHALANRLDTVPAGGDFTNFQWVMIIIGLVIIALLV